MASESVHGSDAALFRSPKCCIAKSNKFGEKTTLEAVRKGVTAGQTEMLG